MNASRAIPWARAIPIIPIELPETLFAAIEPAATNTNPNVPSNSARYGVASLFKLSHPLSGKSTRLVAEFSSLDLSIKGNYLLSI